MHRERANYIISFYLWAICALVGGFFSTYIYGENDGVHIFHFSTDEFIFYFIIFSSWHACFLVCNILRKPHHVVDI